MLARSLGGFACLIALFLAFAAPAAAAPVNDDFVDALVAAGDHVEAAGNNLGATKEAGEPNHAGDPGGASVWFAWSAPRSQQTFVHLCTDGWAGRIGVYRGGAVGGLATVASGRTGAEPCTLFSFPAISSVTYRFAVDGAAGAPPAQGSFELDIHATPLELPSNDLFANAAAVKSSPYEYVSGSTDGATREPGEPGHGGDPAGASVWFRWTAPQSGPMRLFPCLAGFRPDLRVYTGASLAALRQVSIPAAIEAHLLKECQLGGLGGVGFDALAGETYSIAVDGADGGWGRFQLRLAPMIVPVVDTYPPGTYIYKLLRLRGRGIAIQFGSGGGPPGDTFLCKLDRKPFAPCRSPRKWRHLEPGMHRVAVVATDAVGNRDRTPAVRTFRIGGGGR